jgi:hypothetical protein
MVVAAGFGRPALSQCGTDEFHKLACPLTYDSKSATYARFVCLSRVAFTFIFHERAYDFT